MNSISQSIRFLVEMLSYDILTNMLLNGPHGRRLWSGRSAGHHYIISTHFSFLLLHGCTLSDTHICLLSKHGGKVIILIAIQIDDI